MALNYVFISHAVLEGIVGAIAFVKPEIVFQQVSGNRDAKFVSRLLGAALISSALVAYFFSKESTTPLKVMIGFALAMYHVLLVPLFIGKKEGVPPLVIHSIFAAWFSVWLYSNV
eukprot:TRINITY_DN2844_c0_g1_i1.p1 TRINITY_DN2844_c0_g1~~TRINITY_DN2844_c0_g1_i1.p1  ORF type:complete len:115 (+),score=21.39 TRINITY_DN2844_c0_g1_i1:167-511(+)